MSKRTEFFQSPYGVHLVKIRWVVTCRLPVICTHTYSCVCPEGISRVFPNYSDEYSNICQIWCRFMALYAGSQINRLEDIEVKNREKQFFDHRIVNRVIGPSWSPARKLMHFFILNLPLFWIDSTIFPYKSNLVRHESYRPFLKTIW